MKGLKRLLSAENLEKLEEFFHSPLFMLLPFAFGLYGVFGGEEAIMPSLVMNGELFALVLLFSKRFSAGLMCYMAVIAVGAQLMSQWTDILPYLPWGIPIAAALIIADKTDVRRSRVRNHDVSTFDIHDRVNYSVSESKLEINKEEKVIRLVLTIETKYSSVMEYFEIFLERMMMCRRAAECLGLRFSISINGQVLL